MAFKSDVDVAVIGAGAAGLAAAHELVTAGFDVLLVEARDRIGGRAWTLRDGAPAPLDLGCGWLHSADRNPWVQSRTTSASPSTSRPRPGHGRCATSVSRPANTRISRGLVEALGPARGRQRRRAGSPGERIPRRRAAAGPRCSNRSRAITTVPARPRLDKRHRPLHDTGVNWRVSGIGALIAAFGADLPSRSRACDRGRPFGARIKSQPHAAHHARAVIITSRRMCLRAARYLSPGARRKTTRRGKPAARSRR